MKVLHFAETLMGGPATHLKQLLPFQVEAYDKVALLCPSSQKFAAQVAGVETHTFDGTTRSLGGILRLRNAAKQYASTGEYDIVHLHSSFAGGVGRLINYPSHTRVVYCARGWSFAIHKKGLRRYAYETIERLLSARTDAIINISPDEAELARKAGIPNDRCYTVFNGVADANWQYLPDKCTPRKLLFVGRFDRQKGLDILLSAMETLRNEGFELTVIGGPVVGKPTMQTLPEYVRNLGWQSPEVISREMTESHAIIMPSRWEGFGFVAAEAMRAARPVVASKVGGLKDVVIEGETGFFASPNSPTSLVEAIRKLKTCNIAEVGRAGRRRYETHFTSSRMFKEIDLIYKRLIGNANA
ncbi:glycosyltransferase [Rhizobium glycinendophyticum]|uniref:Glycosyltransferase family 4 protein n=1 Tax=Rhizobium glycinendophyticum TaxID=2589807 RepID=A0A504U1Y6_9HYPH|nr:glycosyltransferase [Rhizobium glycinendophyticum]TPP03926.1 glycosyltransferase family 4 protein [Rhizobium glycinendophyticum]